MLVLTEGTAKRIWADDGYRRQKPDFRGFISRWFGGLCTGRDGRRYGRQMLAWSAASFCFRWERHAGFAPGFHHVHRRLRVIGSMGHGGANMVSSATYVIESWPKLFTQ